MATELTASHPINMAVIGGGYWGHNLIRNFQQLGVLRLICDRNETLLSRYKCLYPHVDICIALSDVLSREDIQAVAIATPAETHAAIAKEALMAGKHVFVEKPLALKESCALEATELAEASGLVLMVGHLLQYHPVFLKLKSLVKSGNLGRINYIYSHRLNLGKIRREENILWSFAPHDISMILGLAGELPEQVMATSGNYLHNKIADVTTTHLEFASGLKGHIFVSWLHPFKEQKMVVVGDLRMAVFDDTAPWSSKLLLYDHEIHWEDNIPVPAKAEPECLNISGEEPLKAECQHFLQCVRTGSVPRTDGREGIRVLQVLNAGQVSLNENGRWVQLQNRKQDPVSSRPVTSDSPKIHSTATIDAGGTIGAGTNIWHYSRVLEASTVGENCTIGQNVVIGPEVSIGMGCKIQNNVSIYRGVKLENDVFCGPSVVFTNVHNPRAHIKRVDQIRPTLVKEGATIGANSTIVCGNTIGLHAFVGAGSVVTQDVPDHALVVGNPARQIGWMCQCATRLNDQLVCPDCSKIYVKTEIGIQELLKTQFKQINKSDGINLSSDTVVAGI